jgi:hypothetical protein
VIILADYGVSIPNPLLKEAAMEFSLLALVLVALCNTLYMVVMRLAEFVDDKLPPRRSNIPGTRQPFLYIRDFWTMTWGDFLGVPLIVNGFVHLVMDDVANFAWAAHIGMAGAIVFLFVCLSKNHKPDYGFPDTGRVSRAGVLHLFYLAVGVGAAAMCVGRLVTGELYGTVLWVALAGGAIYILCFFADVKSGNFASLKKE